MASCYRDKHSCDNWRLMMSRREAAGMALTERQRMIVDVIEDSIRQRGYAPTIREIGDAVDLASTSSVSYQLSQLQDKGYLSRGAGRPRTAVVRPPAPDPNAV